MIIRDADFIKVADGVKPDAKKRVVLHGVNLEEGITYHIYKNDIGQIVLDPQVTIPAAEAWLFRNPEALLAVKRGLSNAARGKVTRVNPEEL